MTAVSTAPKAPVFVTVLERLNTIPKTELVESGDESRVDRKNNVIRGVKVLGLESGSPARVIGIDSDETYRYALDAVREAAHLYEGLAVNIDHPSFNYAADGSRHISRENRKSEDRFGQLINVRVTESGMFADLHYLASHPMAERICEAAEEMPHIFALSHHARSMPVVHDDGSVVIEKIVEVHSVDLIGEKPGTTKSLFESEADSLDETLSRSFDKGLHMNNPHEEEVVATTEMEGEEQHAEEVAEEEAVVAPVEPEENHEEVAEMEGEEPAAVDPVEAVKSPFKAKIRELIDSDLDEDTLKEKIGNLISQMNVAADAFKDEDGEEVAEVEGEAEEEPAAEAAESLSKGDTGALQTKIAQLEAREAARETLESAGVQPTSARVTALAGITDVDVRNDLCADWKKADAPKGDVEQPRSAAPVIESKASRATAPKNEGTKLNTTDTIRQLRGISQFAPSKN